MQIPEDLAELPKPRLEKRRQTAPIERLLRQRQTEDETIRLPLSAIAFWRDAVEPELETVAVRLNLPRDPDEEETLAGPLDIARGKA